nr:unnamed protein product [Callosobruchus chinensis]
MCHSSTDIQRDSALLN